MKTNKEEKHEVAIKMENLPSDVLSANWGVIESLETTDLVVPKIYHMQSISDLVVKKQAEAGDFVDNLTNKILVSSANKLEVIIFGSFKTMIRSKRNLKDKFDYLETITITPENAREWASAPFIDGDFKNTLQYNFYCLLPNKINEVPYVLSLGSTKTKTARKINTMIFKLAQIGKPGAAIVFELTNVAEKNDDGQWFGLEVNQGRFTTPDELLKAHAWHVKSKSQKFTVVEEEAQVQNSNEEENEKPF